MTIALETNGLGRRYLSRWGLQDCTFAVPEGKVAALVGPNGAGKSTLLRLAAGLSRPSTGTVRTFGEPVLTNSRGGYQRVGYLDQERPVYRWFRVAEMLEFGRRTNATWDAEAAERWIEQLGIPRRARLRSLSVGQQAQVAVALCLGKQPDLLLLDEPVASLDPLARRQLWSTLMDSVAERRRTVVISSHILSELEPVCDHLIVLSKSRVQLTGDVEEVKASHRVLVGAHGAPVPSGIDIVWRAPALRQDTLVVRASPAFAVGSSFGDWEVTMPSLEEIVLAYLEAGSARS